MKLKTYILSMVMVGFTACLTTSCDDMLDPSNDNILNPTAINNQSQTATYVLGIIKKMQALGVRTNVLGEVRGDLVATNSYATTDMKSIANFDFSDLEGLNNNRFNQPSDYYAVINQCNYFLEYADTAKVSTVTNKSIFAAEYAQVKLYRAWAYMQLGMIYGDNIPFVTKPTITQEEAVSTDVPKMSFSEIIDFLLDDIQNDKVFNTVDNFPEWGASEMFAGVYANRLFFQSNLILGDLYLWKAVLEGKDAGITDALKAAYSYYKYLRLVSHCADEFRSVTFIETDNSEKPYMISPLSSPYVSYGTQSERTNYGEVITVLLMDTASSENNYNYLRNFYNYDEETKTPACIVPSLALDTMSRRTDYCYYAVNSNGRIDTLNSDRIAYTQEALNKHLVGDLRRAATVRSMINNDKVEEVYNTKHNNKYITYTRRSEVWLKFAEALNYAGLPYYANAILSYGVNTDVVNNYIKPRSNALYADLVDMMSIYPNIGSTMLENSTDSTRVLAKTSTAGVGAVGLHARGGGAVQLNKKYFKEAPYDYDLEHKPIAPARVNEPTKPHEQPVPAVIRYYSDTNIEDHYLYEDIEGEKKPKVKNTDEDTYDETYYVLDESKKNYDYQNTPEDSLKFLEVYACHKYRNSYNGLSGRRRKLWIEDKPCFTPATFDDLALIAPTTNLQQTVINEWSRLVKVNVESAKALYEVYLKQLAAYEDSLVLYGIYLEEYAEYKSNLYKWECENRNVHLEQNQATVDSLVLAEQALECAFEGKRYYDLMRRALWYGEPERLADPISRRNSPDNPDSDLYQKLMDRNNWFLKWSDGATGSVGKQ